MPSGLNGFIQNRQEQKNGISLSATEKARRQNIAQNVKIKPTSNFGAPSQHTHLLDNTYPPNTALTRTNLAHVQPSKSDAHSSGDPFDGSILSNDTDDTLRDIIIGSQTQQQPLYFQDNQHEPRRGPFPEQEDIGSGQSSNDDDPNDSDGDDRYDEEENEPGHIGKLPQDYSSVHMGMINGIRAHVNNPPLVKQISSDEQERIRIFMQSQVGQTWKNPNNTLNPGQSTNMLYGRSGRFTGLDIPKETGSVEERSDRIEHNRDQSPDGPAYGNSDLPQTPDRTQEQGTGYDRYSENGFSNREFTEQIFDRKFKNEGVLEGAEHASFSSQSSPTERTSRAYKNFADQKLPIEKSVNKKRTADKLDYDPATLSSMTYAQLKDQSFDTDPKFVPSDIPEELRGSDVSLEDRLKHFTGRTHDEQANFFRLMPIGEWEESGDWFLAQFGDIISRLKHARQAKRDVSKAFEEELASREETVRGKTEEIREVMQRMRAGGEGVLSRRAP